MKGSIRTIAGLLIVFGAVGGIEQGEPLVPAFLIAICGLACMAAGVLAINAAQNG